MRSDGRLAHEVRPIRIQRNYTMYADGSVLVEMGKTVLICTAMVEDRVPPHCLAESRGWLTAEYCMLPSANAQRRSLQAPPGGRSLEIQRLIGRSLRAAVDLHRVPGRTIWVDCDVIQADGGTRTAAITGGFVAVVDALWSLKEKGKFECIPLVQAVAALSVGIVDNRPMVDLCADEDRAASVDMNVVMTHDGRFVEVQGTAEGQPFSRQENDQMLDLVQQGIAQVASVQAAALGERLTI